jgi:hypothetical protein
MHGTILVQASAALMLAILQFEVNPCFFEFLRCQAYLVWMALTKLVEDVSFWTELEIKTD